MTDEIDLDELDVESDDGDDETANRGDWLWREEGDPADEPDGDWLSEGDRREGDAHGSGGSDDERASGDRDAEDDSGDGRDSQPAPHVPRENQDKPVGIPIEQGGAGGGATRETGDGSGRRESERGADQPATGAGAEEGERTVAATGDAPHGESADDMTMAVTYAAASRFANPSAVFSEASVWADWVGIVGEVEAHTINAFQREHQVDVDFFNGSGRDAAERLADVDEHSMFYAERMVVVGLEGEEALAERAGWEFVPLSEAAAKADWELEDTDSA